MPRADRAARFVRALLPHGLGRRCDDGSFIARGGDACVSLGGQELAELVRQGVLASDGETCRAASAARGWLRRRLVEAEPHGAPTRPVEAAGAAKSLDAGPLMRLAAGGASAFLQPYHLEAGLRIRRLTERARLMPRVTMSYSLAHVVGGGGAGAAGEMTDIAADARRRLNACLVALPADCAGVVLDVCGFDKGLQQIEAERRWPRRSAKLVLRIGLDQAATHFGLRPLATGPDKGRDRLWLDEGARPTRFD